MDEINVMYFVLCADQQENSLHAIGFFYLVFPIYYTYKRET